MRITRRGGQLMTRWSEKDFDAVLARNGLQRQPAAEPVARMLPVRRGMNKLETRYARRLELMRLAGEITWWGFEGIKLRLATGAFYKPDFAVLANEGDLQFHETKGFFREAANVRLKVAADLYPFAFYLVRWINGEWSINRVK
jgi:hypothetical protein